MSAAISPLDDEAMRAQKLAAARKKLNTFRASRSSAQSSTHSLSPSGSSSRSRSPQPPAPNPVPPLPLSVTTSDNRMSRPPRSPSRGNTKEDGSPKTTRLRKSRSKGSIGAHKRQQSSMSVGQGQARASVMGLFDVGAPAPLRGNSLHGPENTLIATSEIITTPAAPLTEDPNGFAFPTLEDDRSDDVQVKARLSAFSFGTKPCMRAVVPSNPPLLPSDDSDRRRQSSSPRLSPTKTSVSAPSDLYRLSTPSSSRPPSLLLTRPTPLGTGFGISGDAGPSRNSLNATPACPSTPPTPAGRRHSHTRSNSISISLPNLKLGRPPSLGVSSPSFPSSPCSPSSGTDSSLTSRLSGPINGARLKFEPSGRGAEAEKEKDEYRRKALEKLTGGKWNPPHQDIPSAEISLPDLDDEDVDSVTSSIRPLSGASAHLSGSSLPTVTSTSSALSASPFSWSSPEETSPVERWSGFGMLTEDAKPDGLGFGVDLSLGKRPTLARNLSVLAEVDEDLEDDQEWTEQYIQSTQSDTAQQTSEDEEAKPAEETHSHFVPIIAPTPSRLRDLQLLTSSSTTPSRPSDISTFTFPPPASSSPTKVYGAIGRGRPRPVSGIAGSIFASSATSTPNTGNFATPRSGKRGSRGSSISYKKDAETTSASGSSHEWSIGSKALFSPPLGDLSSPPTSFESPRFAGWGSVPRSNGRPCPKPRSLVGLGSESTGAGRVLGEVDEVEENEADSGWRPDGNPFRIDPSVDVESGESFSWRGDQLEVEMERDALREDVEIWRKRCRGLEERLEAERKDTAVLRERVRKLGDRLSSVSVSHPERSATSPAPEAESSVVAEMRNQLFHLTASLEKERREKEEALAQLADLRPLASVASLQSAARPAPLTFAKAPATDFHLSLPSPVITPATPLPVGDPNGDRMKAWGFPRSPMKPISKPSNKRDSFFGLSSDLRRSSLDEKLDGFDLPPFDTTSPFRPAEGIQRTVSEPLPTLVKTEETHRSTSESSASSAMAFFSSYFPTSRATPVKQASTSSNDSMSSEYSSESVTRRFTRSSGPPDLSGSCACCVGAMIEV